MSLKVGDRVRLKPGVLPVKRVGYPLDWRETTLEDSDLAFVESFKAGKYRSQLTEAILRARVADKNFGGRERTVHRWQSPKTADEMYSDFNAFGFPDEKTVYRVSEKKIRITGTYVPPERQSYESGFEDSPGYVDNQKRVSIFEVRGGEGFTLDSFWITEDDVAEVIQ